MASEIEPARLTGSARRLRLDTLVRLRWLAVIGQSAAVAVVHIGLGFQLPFGPAFLLIAASAGLNLALRVRYPASHRLSDNAATFLLAFDIAQLAALLFLTGGLQNPFSILFLAPVLISATALTPRRTLALGLFVVGCATLLAFFHLPLPWREGEAMGFPALYVAGVWAAILLGTGFTGVYAWRVAEEARQLAQALAATELVLAREQHLSQIDGLAAAAAHELGTPLATIALVSKELSKRLANDADVAEDVALLRDQVERCRAILGQLTARGQEGEGGEFLENITLVHLVEELVDPLRGIGVAIRVDQAGSGPMPRVRRNAGLVYGLTNLLDNAVDFAEREVVVEAGWNERVLWIEIRDDGPGYPAEVLLRLGEPYVTTRGADKRGPDQDPAGHGLGVFIAKTLIERTGAALSLTNGVREGVGAVARVTWARGGQFETAP